MPISRGAPLDQTRSLKRQLGQAKHWQTDLAVAFLVIKTSAGDARTFPLVVSGWGEGYAPAGSGCRCILEGLGDGAVAACWRVETRVGIGPPH